ncbi:MAG: hypothetical protein J6U93_07575 [Alistipes sp.]|nr:hypothetical protein [Alistipes sp.]
MFQGLRENAPIYILDKTNEIPKLNVGYVEKRSDVYSRYGTPTMPMMSQPMDGVVDFSVRIGNEVVDLKKLPVSQSICSPDGHPQIVVSDNREAILAEVDGIERTSQAIVDGYDLNVSIVSACAEMKRVLNPQLAKEQQRDEDINNLKSKIGGIEDTIGRIDEKLEAFLRALSNNDVTAKNKNKNESN